MSLAKYFSGNVIFCLSIALIKSSNWTSALLNSQLTCKVGSSLTINFLSKKKKERHSSVCVVLKIAGFKSQCKPRDFLCRKTLPQGCKAYHLQRGFAITPPHWGASIATWTRCPIHTHHHKLPFLSLNISLLLKLLKCGDSKNYTILFLYWIFQPLVNIVICQNLGDG